MRWILSIFSLLCVTGALFLSDLRADIAPARQFGTTLAPWGISGIRMAEETVEIRLGKTRAYFEATFELKNDTPERVSLDVGFPDSVGAGMWSSDVRKPPESPHPSLQAFEVCVDGQQIQPEPRFYQQKVGPLERTELAASYRKREREIAEASDPEEKARLQAALDRDRESFGWWSSSGWLVWPMTFEPGAVHEVAVTYALPYRGPYRHQLLGFKAVEYVLKSGAFWEGPIGRAVIEIQLLDGLTHDHLVELRPEGYEKTEHGFRWELEALEPTEDVEIVLKDYVDPADAVRGYRELAAEAASKAAAKEAWALCAAWEAARALEPSEVEVELARRILAYERSMVAERGGEFHQHPRIRRDIRSPYVPWEWRLVQSLERNGRTAEARKAAAEALPVLRRWMEDHRGRDANWGRVEIPTLKEAIARCEELVAAE